MYAYTIRTQFDIKVIIASSIAEALAKAGLVDSQKVAVIRRRAGLLKTFAH